MATNYDINYDDERFTRVESDKTAALTDVEKTYGDMIDDSDSFYDSQIDAAQDYEKKQTNIQNQQTDFAIEKINQQKDQAKQDYTKEQSGAYVDWQKQSNQYGADAEQKASMGMANTGYSESSQVSMYNTYQNRMTAAREAFTRATLNYENLIKEARLQNSAALAQIAYESYQKQLELSLAGFQYKNSLVTELAKTKREINSEYYGRYQDVLHQINTENTLKENARQFDEQMEQKQLELDFQKEQFEWQKAQAAKSGGSGGTVKSSSGNKTSSGKKTQSQRSNKAVEKDNGSDISATKYLEQLISFGASKDEVANEISIALREGAIKKEEATQLRNKFTPRGVQY